MNNTGSVFLMSGLTTLEHRAGPDLQNTNGALVYLGLRLEKPDEEDPFQTQREALVVI